MVVRRLQNDAEESCLLSTGSLIVDGPCVRALVSIWCLNLLIIIINQFLSIYMRDA